MAKLLALHAPPKDPHAFDAHYRGTHLPLARKVPGVRRIEINAGPVTTPNGPSPYYLVGLLSFDSLEALQAGLASPEGQAAYEDLANFATAGVTLLVFDDREA